MSIDYRDLFPRDKLSLDRTAKLLAQEAAKENPELKRYARFDRAAIPDHLLKVFIHQIAGYPQNMKVYKNAQIRVNNPDLVDHDFQREWMHRSVREDFEAYERHLDQNTPEIADQLLQNFLSELDTGQRESNYDLYALYIVLDKKVERKKTLQKWQWIRQTQQDFSNVKNYVLSQELGLLALGTQRSMEHYILPKSLDHMSMLSTKSTSPVQLKAKTEEL